MRLDKRDKECEFPVKLSKPAVRALKKADFVRLKQFTNLNEKEILKLHGVGPKAIREIRLALEANGLSFAKED